MVGPVRPGGNGRWSADGHRRVEPVSSAAPNDNNPHDRPVSQNRTLVVVEKPVRGEPARYHYYGANAAFLTHLIATDAGVPQTRMRRRAEPEPSARAYAEAGSSTFSLPAGMILNRSA
ncbi:hypothetical protein [Breoghania sp.]|uniref:hypothetical protein n=1 Tax=Breoghania sp. TaxID=2065378 RepID=UPI002AAB003E|nr:hypothetical protein [Breoghania sp.]